MFKDILKVSDKRNYFRVRTAINGNSPVWTKIQLQGGGSIGQLLTNSQARIDVQAKATQNTIDRVDNDVVRINLRADDGASLSVTTLDQDTRW